MKMKWINFYNGLDSELELNMEVGLLDHFAAEAKEVYKHNKYPNYTLPLHWCREMGYHNWLFDVLDERKLTKDELHNLFVIHFGMAQQFDGVPNAQADWSGFVKALSTIIMKEKSQWIPVTKMIQPWLDMKKLNKAYGGGRSSVV